MSGLEMQKMLFWSIITINAVLLNCFVFATFLFPANDSQALADGYKTIVSMSGAVFIVVVAVIVVVDAVAIFAYIVVVVASAVDIAVVADFVTPLLPLLLLLSLQMFLVSL
jgi:hypothetical protein